MAVFLNDRSLEQYNDWASALKFFLAAAQELFPAGFRLLKDSRFFEQPRFSREFNKLSFPKDQHALILQVVFGNRYYKCWTVDRESSDAVRYSCFDPKLDLIDDSLSEAAERQLKNASNNTSLLSAPDSAFQNKPVVKINKHGSLQYVDLRNALSKETLKDWLAARQDVYDRKSQSAPHDFQTVLIKQTSRFRATGKFERRFGRRIFEEIESGNQLYVDDGHPGHSAHLEVFSAHNEHLGTADINTGNLDISGRVDGRTLKL